MKLKIKPLSEKIGKEIPLPYYATQGAAALDLHACIDEPLTIPPGGQAVVPTGLAVAIPQGYAGLVFARSGLACKGGLAPANKVGVIDADYRGEVLIFLHNHGSQPQTVEDGDRVAQLVIVPYLTAQFTLAEELDSTDRGQGGFGSTGRR